MDPLPPEFSEGDQLFLTIGQRVSFFFSKIGAKHGFDLIGEHK